MLKSLDVVNFSIFSNIRMDFVSGMNVIIGENSTGKSHLLKTAYIVSMLQSETAQDQPPKLNYHLEERIAEKLLSVFRPEYLGNLVNRHVGRGRCLVGADFTDHGLSFSFASNSRRKVAVEGHVRAQTAKETVLLPPNEAMSLFPNLIGSYERREMVMDETYYDLCRKFLAAPLKPVHLKPMADLISSLEKILQGKVLLEQGRFLIKTKDKGNLEIGLLAEGMRKIAQLTYLLMNGSLHKGCILLWDEPESNLNPKLIRNVARAMMIAAHSGIQVVIATHNLFLLRELTLLSKRYPVPLLFTGLERSNSGVVAHQSDELEGLPNITALDEELEQIDQYMDLHQESAT